MAYNPNYRGTASKVPSRATSTGYQNGTLSTIPGLSPVSVDNSGKMYLTDVSLEADVTNLLGIVISDTPSSANGQVYNAGRIEDITTSFAVGDAIYIGKSGTLINVQPDYGVSSFTTGDFVIFVGLIVKNEYDNAKKDLHLMIEKIGQL
jgi:hypothetical protein